MKQANNSRRKFIAQSITGTAAIALVWLGLRKKQKPAKTVKFLTQDGKLVEVDENLVKSTGNKIEDQAVLTWVHNKK